MMINTILGLLAVIMAVSASPAVDVPELQARDAAVDNIVYVTNAQKFWLVFTLNFVSSLVKFWILCF
jgi:hypothetical protein